MEEFTVDRKLIIWTVVCKVTYVNERMQDPVQRMKLASLVEQPCILAQVELFRRVLLVPGELSVTTTGITLMPK